MGRGCLRLAIAAGALAAAAGSAAAPPADRPDIVWIIADDHAAYVTGAYGERRVRTPNIDRLAAEGVRFDRAYCNSPVCTASRQSFLTGRYPRTIGVTQLRTPLPAAELTLAEILSAAGYATAAIGKMHFNSGLRHGFDVIFDAGDYASPDWEGLLAAMPGGTRALARFRPFLDPARVWLNADHLPFPAPEARMIGTRLAAEAERFLKGVGERPFFMIVSFHEPHSPFHFPLEDRERPDPARFVAPAVGPEDAWQIPAIFEDLTEAEKRGIIAAYYTSVEFMDRNVGRVLAALERSGRAERTLVVYFGDHGYMLGQHGRFEKHCSYEPAVRAPLVLRWPGRLRAGAATEALVEFVDLMPTMLDYVGLPTPPTTQGRSLVPVLEGRTDRHRDAVIVEYAPNEEIMIRTERWKLVYIAGRTTRADGYPPAVTPTGRKVLLFDMEADPDEWVNLARRPEHKALVEDLLARLAGHLLRTERTPERLPPGAAAPELPAGSVFDLLDALVPPNDIRPEGG